jgi:2-dehydropantoate 2-reductase
MEIIVLGAGAIGSLYGAKLAATNNVTLIGRARHVAAINAHGLRIEGLESQVVPVRAVTTLDRIGPDALVLVTTKVADTEAALAPIAPLVREDTTIVSLQNGIGTEEMARRALGDSRIVLRAITQFGAIFKSAGVIQFMARGYTLLESHARSERIASVLTAASLECRISPDILRDIWHKLLINCVVNPITAILGSEVGVIANPQLDPLKELVIAECVAVAASQGVALEGNFQEEISDFFRPSHNIASMLQDLRRGRATEIDYLNGAVAALGARHGIECPVNAALTGIIKAMEAKSLLPKKMLEAETG